MEYNKLPDFEYLNDCFMYDEETGFLIWKSRPLHHFKNKSAMRSFNSKFAGKKAGHNEKEEKYLKVKICGKRYMGHRVIFKLMTKNDPLSLEINHIDGNRKNNRWSNLEIVTRSENIRHADKTGLRKMKRGEELTQSKFTESQIIEIHEMHHRGLTNLEIAKKMNTSYQNIKFIVRGETWKHVYEKYHAK